MADEAGFPQGQTQTFTPTPSEQVSATLSAPGTLQSGESEAQQATREEAEAQAAKVAHVAEVAAQAAAEKATTQAYVAAQEAVNPSLALDNMAKAGASLDQLVHFATTHNIDVNTINPDSSVGKVMYAKAGADGAKLLSAMKTDIIIGNTPFPVGETLARQPDMPQPGWTPIKDAQGNITSYKDASGVEHYTTQNTMWQIGFKTSEEYGGGVTEDPSEQAQWVTMGDKQVAKVILPELSALSGGQQVKAYENIGLIDTKQIKEQTPELYNVLMSEGFEAYQKAQSEAFKWLQAFGIITPSGSIDVSKIDLENDTIKKALQAINPQISSERLAQLSPALQEAYKKGGFVEYVTGINRQIKQAEITRNQLLEGIPPLVVTVQDGKEQLNPLLAGKAIRQGELSAETLRTLGYDISDEELAKWAKLSSALDQVKINVTEMKEMELGKFPVTSTGYNYIGAVRKGLLTADDLRDLGFEPEDVDTIIKTAELETKLEPYRETTTDLATFEQRDYTDIGQALVDKAITKDDLIGLGYSEEGIDKAKVYAEQGLKVYIPIYGTAVTFGVSSPLERGISIAGDVLLFIPWYGWGGKVGSAALRTEALAVGIPEKIGVMSRIGAVGKAGLYMAEQIPRSMIEFPIQLLKAPKVALKGLAEVTAFPFVHPLETAKGWGAILTGRAFLGEPLTTRAVKFITQWGAIPEAAIAIPTHGTGVQRVFADSFISRGIPPQEADRLALEATRVMQLKLSDMVVRGEPIPRTLEVPIYENGQEVFKIKFDQSLVMRELGQAIHTTPFAERVMAGATEPTPNKVYFSTAMSPEWTGVTARGYTTPEAVELGRGGAVMKDMRIDRLFDPVSKTYRNTVELEMTTAKGTQLVTGREPILNVLKAEGNVNIYPSVVMEQTQSRNIVDALRAATGKQFDFKPVNFDEVNSIPKGSAGNIKEYVRANDMMVGGSAAERTWTDTVKLPEDIDLISLKNNAKVDAANIARLTKESSGMETRVLDGRQFKVPKEVWRIEALKDGKWEQVTDILDYRVHRTYNPDILNREPVTVEGIKVEHPLEQAERIVAKYGEYQRGEVSLEQHRGHPKRLAWIAEKILDTPGGKLTTEQQAVLEVIGTRIEYIDIPKSKLIRLKLGGLRDAIVDKVAEIVPMVERGVSVKTPDGRTIKVPKTTAEQIESYLKSNPKATQKEIDEITSRGLEKLADENIASRVADGTFRGEAEKMVESDLQLRELPASERNRIIDDIIARETFRLHQAGRYTINDIRGLIYAGTLTSGVARALYQVAREFEVELLYRELAEYAPSEEEVVYELGKEVTTPYAEAKEIVTELPREEIPTERLVIEPEYRPEVITEEVPTERLVEEIPIEEPYKPPEEPYVPPPEEVVPPPEEPYVPPEEPYVPPEEPYVPPEEPYRPLPPKIEVSQIPYEWKKTGIPPGTITWRQGMKWGVLPPPWRDEDKIWLAHPLPGTKKFAVGKGSAYKTLQVLGGRPPQDADIDMGWAQVHISPKAGQMQMTFTGGKEAADDRWAMEREAMDTLERESYEGIPVGLVETSRIPRKRARLPLEDVREIYPPEIFGEGEALSEEDLLLQQIERGLARREASKTSVSRIGNRYYDEEDMIYIPPHYRRKVGTPIVEESNIKLPTKIYLGRKLRQSSVGTGV